MRDLHPDLAMASQDEEIQSQANTLAVLLNEIYDTLMDEDKRATYNALSGFATDSSVNPFEDSSFPKDQAFVVRELYVCLAAPQIMFYFESKGH
jgi:curved DNA-binding protein CbpA